MIPKGNQRAGGQNLATHLMNSFDNEQVEIAEVRGSVAQDLHGAFAEWYAQSKTTKCRKYLYSLSVNPDNRQGALTREQYLEFLDSAEKRIGLTGQPRAVVFHIKEGRQHCHAVWSRIDTREMKAVQISHDHQALRKAAQDFARDHGLELPEGMKNDRGKDRYKDRHKQSNLTDNQQKERTGQTKKQRMDMVTKAWRESDNAQSFARALEEHGYHLAKGDKRAVVIVDRHGEIYSLSRQIDGAKAKDITARINPDHLSDINTAHEKAKAAHQQQAQDKQAQEQRAERQAEIEKRRQRMLAEQEGRQQRLDAVHKELTERHGQESRALQDHHKADTDRAAAERLAKQPKGIMRFVARVTGITARADRKHQQMTQQRADEQQKQQQALAQRHAREQGEIERRRAALERVAVRERMALETRLKREQFQQAAERKIYQLDQEKERRRISGLSKKFAEALERHEPHKPEGKEKADMRSTMRDLFNRAVDRIHQQPVKTTPAKPKTLTEEFSAAQERHEPHKPEGKEREDLRQGLRGSFNAEAEKTETGKSEGDTGKGEASLHHDFGKKAGPDLDR